MIVIDVDLSRKQLAINEEKERALSLTHVSITDTTAVASFLVKVLVQLSPKGLEPKCKVPDLYLLLFNLNYNTSLYEGT